MTQERQNHVIMLHTHKDRTDNINLHVRNSLFPLTTDELIFLVIFLMFNNITQLNIRSAPPPPQLKLHSYPSACYVA